MEEMQMSAGPSRPVQRALPSQQAKRGRSPDLERVKVEEEDDPNGSSSQEADEVSYLEVR